MPVDFLTDEQEQRYGRYALEPTPAQLARYFHLDDADTELVKKRRGNHNRLGFALQLCTVRFLGTFLSNPIEVPNLVVEKVANQLGITDLGCLTRYLERDTTHREHAGEIQQHYGYRDFSDQPEHWRLVRWLYGRTWLSAERPSILFDLATARLVERKILLPGVSVLARLVASVRDRAANRLWRVLSQLPNTLQRTRLDDLLQITPNTRTTPLDRLRRSPTRSSAPALVGALNRLVEVRAIGVNTLSLSAIPKSQLKVLARTASSVRAQAIARMPPERRTATLLAFVHVLEATATDDAIDLLDLLIGDLLASSKRIGERERLRTIKDLDAAALQLCKACGVLLDSTCDDQKVRDEIFTRISKEQLTQAISKVEALARPDDDDYGDVMMRRWKHVRIFLPRLLHTIQFEGTEAGQPILEALQFLHTIEGRKKPDMSVAPLAFVSKSWLRLVKTANGEIDRRAYTFCVLERLRHTLRRRDLFVSPSLRWGDPRAKLLQGDAWISARPTVCRTLDLHPTPQLELEALAHQLDEAYRRTALNLPTNAAVRIEQVDGRDTIVLTGLDKLEEPLSLIVLRDQVSEMLPRADLPEILLEIQARTGFANEFTHLSKENARVEDLSTSICAVLLAEACNIGLEPLIRPDVPALTRGRLSWVQQNYIRMETLTSANARLVDAQTHISLVRAWGGGEVASADGLRFTVPVRTINARPNSKYFGVGRGITYYNFTSDQFTGFHGIIIPGTLRDSLFLLEGLLEQQTSLRPIEIMTDTAGYSDVVFGLFWLLGYQFSPRIADIGETRFWRIDESANYGALNGLARNRVNTELIANNWDDMLRVAGSLKLGTVSASELMRTLQGGSSSSTLSKAIGELGRIAKTLYLLPYIDDETYRRRVLTQLNRGEGRHSLARVTFHGQRGEVRQRYREGQEDQLGALGLVVNVLVLWNTNYMDVAIKQLQNQGEEVKSEDLARLSPLGYKHINMLGRYQFTLAEHLKRGELRPLRDPKDFGESYS
ncbi:Tn3 family transposase [Iningainema tapete]|uniref:Tn3 family transposase n=1 Tax=Iningainema tapete BLCC-T55 TaxID=2748662 RepID=A0A8J6XLQ4_9CYAN|nr:Tn3 family transposase [Iningainema tapete]MBD2773974.1 Tn3 family transposase [Iningainema tapete BLCC-T55]